MTDSDNCAIQIVTARIANFRSLVNVEVPMGPFTVLVGPNNGGKTTFLDALYLALGAGRRTIEPEDLHIGADEPLPPRDREALIDILLRPIDPQSAETLDTFPAGSYWTEHWGRSIAQDDQQNDFVGIRTRIYYSASRATYALERLFLREWRDFEDWTQGETGDTVTARQVEPITLHYMDAKRDLDDEIRRPGSFWRRLTEDFGLSDEEVAEFEATLTEINEQMVERSAVLQHLRDNLSHLYDVIGAPDSHVDISPLSRRLRDLAKGVDVSFKAGASQPFALTRHGMGTRSLASLLVFKAFVSWKQTQASAQHESVHPFLALEEPEAHLHPQAQRALASQVGQIPGQRIVSSHSPYFAAQAGVENLRVLTKHGASSRISRIPTETLDDEELRKLNQEVMATRGDLLFASAVVLFEGPTEEQAFPLWANEYWGMNPHVLGINFIGVGGYGRRYSPFIWLCKSLGIPWFIFSDGEDDAIHGLDAALNDAGEAGHADLDNIMVLPDGSNFETYLVRNGYQGEIEEVARELRGPGGIDSYAEKLDGKPKKKGAIRDYSGAEGRTHALEDFLSENKTQAAPLIARTLCALEDHASRVPPPVAAMFDMIDQAINSDSGRED